MIFFFFLVRSDTDTQPAVGSPGSASVLRGVSECTLPSRGGEAQCPGDVRRLAECWMLGVTLSAPHSVPSRGGSSLVLQDVSPSTRHHSPAHIRCCRIREATMSALRHTPRWGPSWGQSHREITTQIWDLKHMGRREGHESGTLKNGN